MGVEQIWLFDHDRPSDILTENEVAFIASRDSVYMPSVSETGWPYVQHRGGKAGFLKVVDERTMAFADYRGNRQYISAGNLAVNDRDRQIRRSQLCANVIIHPKWITAKWKSGSHSDENEHAVILGAALAYAMTANRRITRNEKAMQDQKTRELYGSDTTKLE